jgi:hypothetical protein
VKVSLGACSNIIRKANYRVKITGNPDLCALENIQPEPNSLKGSNKKLTPEEEKRLIELALQDATHYRMPFAELGAEAGLDVCVNTIRKTLASDNIHRRKPTKKPLMSSKHKADRLAFCLKYRSQNWHDIIFTDESYFETSALRTRRSRGVLRRPGEAFIDRNLDRKFHGGATVMIWGAIIYGQTGTSALLL